MAAAIKYVDLVCVKSDGKLRVRITTPGYFTNANCQFPRDLRIESRKFKVPEAYVRLIAKGTKYYYSVSKRDQIQVIDDNITLAQFAMPQLAMPQLAMPQPAHIFEDDSTPECNICMVEEKTQVFVPCGHYYTCGECSKKLRECPMCRESIKSCISRDLIE